MYVLGVDLAGPAGAEQTGLALFTTNGERLLRYAPLPIDGSDQSISEAVQSLSMHDTVIVGLDAPLSYEPGGGQRGRDADLRRVIIRCGLPPGSVMAPTAPRMVYLTLRGIVLAQALSRISSPTEIRLIEVHPGAAMCLRGAPVDALRSFATTEAAGGKLLRWLSEQYILDVPSHQAYSPHFVAACAAAVAAHGWATGSPRWLATADPPWHPYDFAA